MMDKLMDKLKGMKTIKDTDELLFDGDLGDKAVMYSHRCALIYEKHYCNDDCLGIRLVECIPYPEYKLFKILGGYAPTRIRWYYLLGTSRALVRRSFIQQYSWLKPYKVELVTDESEIYDVLHDEKIMPM